MQISPNLSSPPTSDEEEVETREQEATRDIDAPFYIGVSIPIVLLIIVDILLLYVFHVF